MAVLLFILLPSTGFSFWPPAQNVQISKSITGDPFGPQTLTVTFQATDPRTGVVNNSSVSYPGYNSSGAFYDWDATVSQHDGVVAWVARIANASATFAVNCEVNAAIYDPVSQSWKRYSRALPGYINGSDGYDWNATSLVKDGMVAWSEVIWDYYGQPAPQAAAYVECAVYDPVAGQWTSYLQTDLNSLYPASFQSWSITNMNILNGVLSWSARNGTGTPQNYVIGYNPKSRSWEPGFSAPIAYIAALPSSGPAPLTVWLLDMSVGATTWSLNYGDGGMTTSRSTYHIYNTPGIFTAMQSVTGPGGSDSASQTISNFTPANVFNYTIANGQITITGYTGPGGVVNIPNTIDTGTAILLVTGIGSSAFQNKSTITSVTIPNTVTSIGNYAFYSCGNLTSITIPSSVTSIGGSAFNFCTNLASVTIPNSVTSIGSYAFAGCVNLTSMSIPNSVTSIGADALGLCTKMNSITVDPLNPVYSSSLDGVLFNKSQATLIQCPAGKFGSYTVPSGVTGIGSLAFNGCNSLTSVAIASSVISIASDAFWYCTSLNSLTVDPLNSTYSSSLDGVLFNKSKTTLIACGGGKTGSYTIPSSVTIIGNNAFVYCISLAGVVIPSSVTSIGNSAFEECKNLASVAIPNGVNSIGSSTFEYCSSLTTLSIPTSVRTIGTYACYGCNNLNNVLIPPNVTTIGSNAFTACNNLTTITIPSSVTSLGSSAFQLCSKLKSAIFNGNAPSMGSSVFASAASGFTVYYYNGGTGFASPTWNGYPAVNMGAYSPASGWLVSAGLAYNMNLQSTPNGDGVKLLMDYALNLDPTKNQSANLPKPVVAGTQMSMTFYSLSAGVTYTVRSCTDLSTWSTAGVVISGPDANGVSTATVNNPGPNRFMRLEVSY